MTQPTERGILSRLIGAGPVPALVVIVMVGAWLRLDGIGSRSFWLDEAMTASFLDMDPAGIVRRCAEPLSVHPPLYYVAARCWAGLVGDSEGSLRGLSALLGLATILGCYLLVRDLARLDPAREGAAGGAALLAALLVALSPMQVELSRTARGYTLVTACLGFGSWALVRALGGRPRGAWWLASSVLFAAACYAHYVALLSVAAAGCFAAARVTRDALNSRRAAAGGVGGPGPAAASASPRWAIAAAVVFLLVYALPWLPMMARHSETIRHHSFTWEITWEKAAAQAALAMLSSYDVSWDVDPNVGGITALLLGGLTVYLAARGGWRRWFLVAAGVVPSVLMVAYSLASDRSIFHARYLCFAQVAWLQGIAVAATDIPSRAGRWAVAAALAAGLGLACYGNRSLLGGEARPGMRAAVLHVTEHRRPGEVFVAQTPYAFFGARYYARGPGRPALCVLDPRRQAHFGSEHLRDEELVVPDAVLAGDPPGAWLISTDSYDPSRVVRVPFPDGWELEEVQTFDQDRWLEKPVRVSHYRFVGLK